MGSVFINRQMLPVLTKYASKFPVVAVVGPRQSGKTTIVRKTFSEHKYFSLEDPDTMEMVRSDPRDFLERDYGTPGIIIDEFQNDPTLLSYMQGIVDRSRRPGYFILTGSHNFLMNQAISQSLAGRVALLNLLPLSLQELSDSSLLTTDVDEAIFKGGYPDIFSRSIHPPEFYPQYTKTYVERDVRQLVNVIHLSEFQRFMRLCAGRIGQLLNISSLADDCNISVSTANSWLSILEASYVIFLLQPHFKNFSKRLIKSPKLYFHDTGLACWLLKIGAKEQVREHYLRGGLFESLVLSELNKQFYNRGEEPSIYFWRDSHGHEIDCLLDHGTKLIPVEIKSGKTINSRFFSGLNYWCNLAGIPTSKGYVVYAGTKDQPQSRGNVISWQSTASIAG
jgi:predicted AAA+ superfamily ATPase